MRKIKGIGCKVIYGENIFAFTYILKSPSSFMTLHPIPSEYPYKWEKVSLFFQCTTWYRLRRCTTGRCLRGGLPESSVPRPLPCTALVRSQTGYICTPNRFPYFVELENICETENIFSGHSACNTRRFQSVPFCRWRFLLLVPSAFGQSLFPYTFLALSAPRGALTN